jgi:hypothetical protein
MLAGRGAREARHESSVHPKLETPWGEVRVAPGSLWHACLSSLARVPIPDRYAYNGDTCLGTVGDGRRSARRLR